MLFMRGSKYLLSYYFQSPCFADDIGYEGLVHGLNLVEQIGVGKKQAIKNSKLIVKQIYGKATIIDTRLRYHVNNVRDLIESFETFGMQGNPQS